LNCGVSSNGQVSGSFVSNTNTAGNYAVTVTDNAGFSAGSFAYSSADDFSKRCVSGPGGSNLRKRIQHG
jgi:hypothetical protein